MATFEGIQFGMTPGDVCATVENGLNWNAKNKLACEVIKTVNIYDAKHSV